MSTSFREGFRMYNLFYYSMKYICKYKIQKISAILVTGARKFAKEDSKRIKKHRNKIETYKEVKKESGKLIVLWKD